MASNRHLGRIIALQTLYEQDFRKSCADKSFVLKDVLKRNIKRFEKVFSDNEFVEQLVKNINKLQPKLDTVIQPAAPKWPLDKISRIDLIILRIGTFELLHDSTVPAKVVINEAVELAKSFGGENSSKFVNGVLGTILRQHGSSEDAPKPKKGSKK